MPLLFYPAYFLVANIIDSALGDQQLINWLLFDSRSLLLKIFFKDWFNSAPIMYIIFYLLILPLELFSRKFFNSSTLFVYFISLVVIAAGSYMTGFTGLALIINTLAVLSMIYLFYISQALLFCKLK